MPVADFGATVDELTDELISLRRELHRVPELGFEELKTSAFVAERLRALGLDPQTGVATTGVVALIEGATPGATLLVRADMDGLPVDERTEVDYRSTHAGRMHACGHDAHVAMLLVAARVLVGMRARLRGTVKLVFQPAEEGLGGARVMIEEGVLESPHVDAALGFHI
ncbi:MAG: amidohydrolase, partial [Chloroflexota bacterium]|nr:amidohydrolase [Chloroflexota bacterium]